MCFHPHLNMKHAEEQEALLSRNKIQRSLIISERARLAAAAAARGGLLEVKRFVCLFVCWTVLIW